MNEHSPNLGRIVDAIERAPVVAGAGPLTPVVQEPPYAKDDIGFLPAKAWHELKACALEPETDIGNGRRFLARHGDDVLSVENLGFFVFDGKRWAPDFTGQHIRPLAHGTVEAIEHETLFLGPTQAEWKAIVEGQNAEKELSALEGKGKERTPSDLAEMQALKKIVDRGDAVKKRVSERKSKRLRYCKTSGSSGKVDNMLKEAAVYRARNVSVLDFDPYAVNLENGTLRFVRGKSPKGEAGKGPWTVRLDRHEKDNLISKLSPIVYDETAECPQFLNFLETVQPDETVRSFTQRYLGYALTALTVEQVFVFFYGKGRNGKSTLVDLICKLLGDYATTVPFETLAGDDRRKGSEATPDLVRVPGARVVRASEPETGMTFRESMVKSLTSGEPILLRRMREEFIEVYPTFKLIISGNHKPNIKGADDGIWRRVLLVPWLVQIPKEHVDKDLPEKLWAERAGVLNWLIAGALSYLESGLAIPEAVRAATDEYREQSDSYAAFLNAACTITGNSTDMETPGDLYAAYQVFCKQQGFFCVNVATFAKALPDKVSGLGASKAKTNGLSVYRGLRIRDEFRPSDTHGYAEQRG